MSARNLVIALPQGLGVSGITLWAVRLANAWAASGDRAMLLVHGEPPGVARLDLSIHRDVRIEHVTDVPGFGSSEAVHTIAMRYGRAIDAFAGGDPVIAIPNLHGDCYGAFVQMMQERPGVRLIGWAHNDVAYDFSVLRHASPALSAVVGVSRSIEVKLRQYLPDCRIERIAYGVEVPSECVRRHRTHRPARLLYTGRMDHYQKRVLSLIALSDALDARGIRHRLLLVGDGPAADEVDRACDARGSVRRIGAVPQDRVRSLLMASDIFVLGSRFEGLSVSMLEALAAGCVPVVTRVASGAAEAIADGVNGATVEIPAHADEATVGGALAERVADVLGRGVEQYSIRAWETARDRYTIERHTSCAKALYDHVIDSERQAWPPERPFAYSASNAGVPADATDRVRALMGLLAGRAVAVHGTGRHTRVVLDELLGGPARIVGFCDDDRQHHGSMLAGLPVIAPADASGLGATDLIISSALHEADIWQRRSIYERQAIRVHRLYAAEASPQSDAA